MRTDRAAAVNPVNTVLQKGRKSTQLSRLQKAMATVASREGRAAATVSAVIAEAGVSRPTFYDYFEDRDDCFNATAAAIQGRLLDRVHEVVGERPPERAAHAAIDAIVEFVADSPGDSLFLMSETLGAGPGALDIRDEGVADAAKLIDRALKRLGPDALVPDISSAVLVGGVMRWLAAALRRGEQVDTHRDELHGWLAAYERRIGDARWRTGRPRRGPALSPFVAGLAMRGPARMAPGRSRLTGEEITENRRLRIMHAVGLLARERGYSSTTVRDITRLAGVDGRAFYGLFHDKQDAFMAIHELGFQETMAITAGAFFAGESWPERSWEAARAFTQFLENNPNVTQVGFVEAYAVGPDAVQRVEDSHTAFAIFLQEGYEHTREGTPPSPVAVEATITTIFELIYRQARLPGPPKIAGHVGPIMHLWLAPFLGTSDADAFIDAKLHQQARG